MFRDSFYPREVKSYTDIVPASGTNSMYVHDKWYMTSMTWWLWHDDICDIFSVIWWVWQYEWEMMSVTYLVWLDECDMMSMTNLVWHDECAMMSVSYLVRHDECNILYSQHIQTEYCRVIFSLQWIPARLTFVPNMEIYFLMRRCCPSTIKTSMTLE